MKWAVNSAAFSALCSAIPTVPAQCSSRWASKVFQMRLSGPIRIPNPGQASAARSVIMARLAADCSGVEPAGSPTRCQVVQAVAPSVPAPAPIDHERLTPRESEVLTYLSKGFTIKEIASLMGIKWFTVNDHIKSIYKKLNVSSRAEAAVLASKQGLV